MLKFLLIVVIVGYVLVKGLGFFFRIMMRKPTRHQYGSRRPTPPKPTDGNVNIDYVPEDKKSDGKDLKGGEYVDFEEVD